MSTRAYGRIDQSEIPGTINTYYKQNPPYLEDAKIEETKRGKGHCRCESPARNSQTYLFLTLSTAFLETANHSASKLAQYAFLEYSEQLAGAFCTRDWTFTFACFSNQQEQVRESPGFGTWDAEKKNPLGASLEDSNHSLHTTLALQT